MYLSRIFNLKKVLAIIFCAAFALISDVKAEETVNHDSQEVAHVESSAEHQVEEEDDINKVILHHISDSHEWHFWGHGEHKVAIPLPVILWTEKGLVTFLSNKYEKDEKATQVFVENGQSLINFHGSYYYPSQVQNSAGQFVDSFDEYHRPTNAKPLDL